MSANLEIILCDKVKTIDEIVDFQPLIIQKYTFLEFKSVFALPLSPIMTFINDKKHMILLFAFHKLLNSSIFKCFRYKSFPATLYIC
jgi:hypothetical protein